MKLRYLLFGLAGCFSGLYASAQPTNRYVPLDESQPIAFLGDRIRFQGEEIRLGEKSFFVDGQLSEEEVANYPYVFRSFNEAAASLTAGTEEAPMTVYLAPYVYWIDDPDDPAVRVGKDGREPFGLIVECPYLHLVGLNTRPENTVLASNRGQTQGAVGNFTMFEFRGDGLRVENLTMGNFCNVDLEYPLKKELGRPKRMSAITQAHVAYCRGDKVVASNVRFISRLNLNPLNGARRILFHRCHLECTDDALTGTGVYLDCTLDFYGQKPFWTTSAGGAVFLNCNFGICHDEERQYFCKSEGPLCVVDCRFRTKKPVYIGWTQDPTDYLRCYQFGVERNGEPYVIGSDKPENTVCMADSQRLGAFRLTDGDTVVYNTYNLLRGDDEWDPLHVKNQIEAIGRRDGRDYTNLPVSLSVEPSEKTMQTGTQPVTLTATPRRPGDFVCENVPLKWKVQPGFEQEVHLSMQEGNSCGVEALNRDDDTKHFIVTAAAADGLEGAVKLAVVPDFVEAPPFTQLPTVSLGKGAARVDYALDLQGRTDESMITWYRCADKDGRDAVPVAVSRGKVPESVYPLRKEDIGHYLMASVVPKHVRCLPGREETAVSAAPVQAEQAEISSVFETDFRNFPCQNQPRLLPGYWTLDGYKPADTAEYGWNVSPEEAYWTYGGGINGACGDGLLQVRQGARMLYTPLEGTYRNMTLTVELAPAKTAGQGFGSATGQYMDVYIKFDSRTLTGYALRIVRTTKYSDAVDFLLVKYTDGRVEPLGEAVSSTCYRTPCTVTLKAEAGKLTAHAETAAPPSPAADSALKPSVDLVAEIDGNEFGGTGIQHTGTCGEGATLLRRMRVEWK